MTVLVPIMYGQLLNDPQIGGRCFASMRRANYAMNPMTAERCTI